MELKNLGRSDLVPLTLGIIFGLISALSWGISDFLAKRIIDKVGIFKSLLYAQLFGLLPLLIYFKFYLTVPIFTLETILFLIFMGTLGTMMNLTLFKAFEIGPISITSPVASLWGVITAILGYMFLKESLTQLQISGIILATLGLVLVSFKYSDFKKLKFKKISSKGIYVAVIAMLGWGLFFTLMKPLVVATGKYFPIIVVRLIAVTTLPIYLMHKNDFPILLPRNILLVLVIVGLLDATSFLAYNYGISSAYVSIVAPLAALYPAPTIILARIFLKEMLEINQKVGIVSILSGLVLLSIV